MTAIDRTAYPRFKRVVSVRELAEAFTPTYDEVGWARGRTQNDEHCLALVIRLKSYQRLGYFPKLDAIPAVVIDHVRAAVDLPDSVKGRDRRQPYSQAPSGVRPQVPGDKVRGGEGAGGRRAGDPHGGADQGQPGGSDQRGVGGAGSGRLRVTGLHHARFGDRDDPHAGQRGFHAMVEARADGVARKRLERLLLVDPATRRSEFDRIKTPAKAATLGKFKARLAYLRELDALGPTQTWLDGVPPGKVAHFAGEATMVNVDDMRKCRDAKRITLLISLLHHSGSRPVRRWSPCSAGAWRPYIRRVWSGKLREAHRTESERLIGVFGDVLAGAREATRPSDEDSGVEQDGGDGYRGRTPGRAAAVQEPGRRWRPGGVVGGV